MKTSLQTKLYKAISLIAHPVFVFPVLIAIYFDSNQLPALLTVLLLSFALPFIYFLYLYKRGKISNFDVTNRTQRYPLYGATLVGLILSVIYLYFFSSAEIFHDFSRLIAIGVLIILFNFKIKVSVHTALITLLCFSLFQDFGVSPLIFLLVPIVAYSRLILKRHRPLELLLGVLIPAVFYIW